MTLKRIMLTGAVLIALCFGCCGGCFVMSFKDMRDAESAANAFLDDCGKGKLGQAYEGTASNLKSDHSRASFVNLGQTLALDEFNAVNWTDKRASTMGFVVLPTRLGRRTEEVVLTGEAAFRSGAKSPIRMVMHKELGNWRVAGIHVAKLPAPGKDECVRLVVVTIRGLEKAIQSKDFKQFHAEASKLWRDQTTPQQMADAFRSFAEQKIELLPFRDVAPTFDRAANVDEKGILTIAGYVRHKTSRLKFEFKYALDMPQWRPFAVKIEVKPD